MSLYLKNAIKNQLQFFFYKTIKTLYLLNEYNSQVFVIFYTSGKIIYLHYKKKFQSRNNLRKFLGQVTGTCINIRKIIRFRHFIVFVLNILLKYLQCVSIENKNKNR